MAEKSSKNKKELLGEKRKENTHKKYNFIY